MQTPRVLGRFEIGHRIGAGATGTVYAARDEYGRDVAIKVLHEEQTNEPGAVERFRREALHAARIRSEFVAGVVDSGCTDDRVFWIAYEHLEGETLEECLHREGWLSASAAHPIIRNLLQGLVDAHAVGVIHRDVKPANIFLERARRGQSVRARLLDFGIAKYRPVADGATSYPALTSVVDTLGTAVYMPPEQFGAPADVDARADQYAVGVVGFRMLTGVLPFGGRSQTVMLHAKLCEPPRALDEVTGAAWPSEVNAFFRRTLAPEPEDRFATATEVLHAWNELAELAAWPDPKSFDRAVVDAFRADLLAAEATAR